MKKKIGLLGATGSIGTSALDVLRNNPESFELVAFSFYSNIELAKKIIEEFQPVVVGVRTKAMVQELSLLYPQIKFQAGMEGLVAVATAKAADIVLTALTGSVGLLPTMAAIESGKDIALANKETLVMAGQWVMQAAKEKGVKILPVDSEHSAIFQVLQSQDNKNVKELIITASGGSFRDLTREKLKQVTLEDALKHPNWSMGKKITIDSSTMVNKGLEVIEAHWLFDASYDKIKVVLHRESTVHSMIKLVDGAYFAQLGPRDMREPIQYALTFPKRTLLKNEKDFDIADVSTLHFDKLDEERFPMLTLAFVVGGKGGSFPTVFNAANEVAVNAFIDGKIKYLEIEELIKRAVSKHQEEINLTLEMVIEIDKKTRQKVYKWIEELKSI
ncbi:MAG: 1-deoxy-D-xylulose-5-phosphate reductoisomerase [Streptococcaceae bacterium]|jgi:1-deoxy-D-xylulose-5-phosphate reductoisomerase|nr:1-deoxy-D-xylulose-5-phosphate reductoisomerase [Streptococcaceae bacterium]